MAAPTTTELVGHARTVYPFFEYVRAINADIAVQIAIDPTRFPSVVGQTCDIYVVSAKSQTQWGLDPTLSDVSAGGAQAQTFSATNIQSNVFQVAAGLELNANAGLGLGVGYDVVLDCDRNGSLNDPDFIDGGNGQAGFYVVHDTTSSGPLAVTEAPLYSLDPAVAESYGVPDFKLAEDLYYPTNINAMGKVPLIVIGRGNGHNYQWYDHIGNHMASYGYVVMSHDNNTEPGPLNAAATTLGHTDAFLDQVEAGAIAGGVLSGHIDAHRIVWIGHSRGAEGVAIAFDRLFDGSYLPVNYSAQDIRLISSMLPTDFESTGTANPHNANYHLWTASGDSDVDGRASGDHVQTFHLHDRATGYRQSTVVQGTGHAWFHDGPDGPSDNSYFTGPCSIGPTNNITHRILLGHLLPLIKHYVEGNVPALDFLTRQYESFRPIGIPSNPCVVVSHEYRNGAAANAVIDDYQSQPATGTASSGASVSFDVDNLSENRLDDNNNDFTWNAADPFNGATQAAASDDSRGVVFDWTNQDRFYEWQVVAGQRDFASYRFLSLRGAQGTQHPNTLATGGDLTFSVTLRDGAGTSSTINIGANGGGFEQPYARSGGWHNEMESIRLRTTDFLNNGSGLNLSNVVAVRLNVGPAFGSNAGRVVIDELMLTNDEPVYGLPAPKLRVAEIVLDYHEVELGFAFTKAVILYNEGSADLEVSLELSTPPGDPNLPHWSELNTSPTVTIAPFDQPLILRQVYEPTALGPHTIHMLVHSNDPSLPTQPVTLTGVGVTPVPIDTVLVLDRSFSMSEPAGDRIKIRALRDASMLYTDLLRVDIGGTGSGDKLALWKYNHQNSQYLALDFMTDARKAAIGASELSDAALSDGSRIAPAGDTGIGGAMQNAAALLGGPIADRKQVMVVLTDGKENVSPDIGSVVGPIQTANPALQMYSVGLGANIEPAKLQAITNMGAGGYHQVSGSLSGEKLFDLETFYFKIFSNATGMDLVVDPTHVVSLTNPTPVIVDRATIISSDRHANFLILDDPALRAFYDVEFVSPAGVVLAPGATVGGIGIQETKRHTYKIYRVVFPDLAQAPAYVGDWLLRLKPNGKWSRDSVKRALTQSSVQHSSFISPYQGLVPIGFAAAVASNYKLQVALGASNQLPGASVRLDASLSDRGWPAPNGQVEVKITAPNNSTQLVTLYDDGSHGDSTAGDATWSNSFTQTGQAGVYAFLFHAVGRNARGELAPREATRYLTLKSLEPDPPPDGPCLPCWALRLFVLLALVLLMLLALCCWRQRRAAG